MGNTPLNVCSSLKFTEYYHILLPFHPYRNAVICNRLLLLFYRLKKKQKSEMTVTSLESWASNPYLLTPVPVLFPLHHTFSSINEKVTFMLECYSKLLAVEESCCSGENSGLSDMPVLPLTSPWWSLRTFLPFQFHYPANLWFALVVFMYVELTIRNVIVKCRLLAYDAFKTYQ